MSLRSDLIKEIKHIMTNDFDILEIGHRHGHTSYIDFIKQNELPENVNVMKGFDDFGRPFIVFKAEIMYENPKYNKKTFTTFFQRYADDDYLWHTCGHDGPNIFDTVGGTNISQLKLLGDLLKNGCVELTPDMDYDNLKLKLNVKIDMKPIKIILGYSI